MGHVERCIETDRKTQRQIEKDADRQTGQTVRETDGLTYRPKKRYVDGEKHTQTEREREKDRETDEKDRKAERGCKIERYISSVILSIMWPITCKKIETNKMKNIANFSASLAFFWCLARSLAPDHFF